MLLPRYKTTTTEEEQPRNRQQGCFLPSKNIYIEEYIYEIYILYLTSYKEQTV